MSFFSDIEKSLENIIEKTLMGGFSGRVHPVEVARSLWREVSANKRTSMGGTYVPNSYEMFLSPADYVFIRDVKNTIGSEIIEHLKIEAKKRDFWFIGPVSITWIEDKDIPEGQFKIKVKFTETKEKKLVAPSSDVSIFATKKRKGQALENLVLSVTAGFDVGRSFVLDKREQVIGRDEKNDIIIGDPTVSRRHAKIFFRDNTFYIEDLGSRKGVFVNDKKINSAPLSDGDEIRLGLTTLKFSKL